MLQKLLLVALCALAPGIAGAQEKFKIGFISTMSGPAGTFGTETLAGINLGIKRAGGSLGGVPVEVVTGDDQTRPEIGKQLAEKMMQQDRVNLEFQGTPGEPYRIDASASPAPGMWSQIGVVTADGSGVIHFSDIGPTLSSRFYRCASP